jgi:hypothetical protein
MRFYNPDVFIRKILIPGGNSDSKPGNNTVRIADVIETGNMGIEPGITVKSIRDIPKGIPKTDLVWDAFPGNSCRNHVGSDRRKGSTILWFRYLRYKRYGIRDGGRRLILHW